MISRIGSYKRQRGVAVITALLLTTLAITIVASLFWQQQVQVRSIENQRLQLQKQWIMRGAMDYAMLILNEDAKNSQTDNLTEPWAVPLADTRLDQYVENGRSDADASDATLSGNIVDAQSRYNLANLCVNGTINPREILAFQRLLVNLRLNPELAQAAAETMLATQRRAPNPTAGTGGSEPTQAGLVQVEDLLAVPGVSVDTLNKLKNYVIVLPRPTPINLNTAPAEIIAARIETLSLSDATALVASRERAFFIDGADFINRLQSRQISLSGNDVSVTTNYFLVNGRIRLNRALLETQALIERNTGSKPKIVWVREN